MSDEGREDVALLEVVTEGEDPLNRFCPKCRHQTCIHCKLHPYPSHEPGCGACGRDLDAWPCECQPERLVVAKKKKEIRGACCEATWLTILMWGCIFITESVLIMCGWALIYDGPSTGLTVFTIAVGIMVFSLTIVILTCLNCYCNARVDSKFYSPCCAGCCNPSITPSCQIHLY
jgi:hypothetical protein